MRQERRGFKSPIRNEGEETVGQLPTVSDVLLTGTFEEVKDRVVMTLLDDLAQGNDPDRFSNLAQGQGHGWDDLTYQQPDGGLVRGEDMGKTIHFVDSIVRARFPGYALFNPVSMPKDGKMTPQVAGQMAEGLLDFFGMTDFIASVVNASYSTPVFAR